MINFRTLPVALLSFSLLAACQQSTTVDVTAEKESLDLTFDELKVVGKNLECTFEHTDEDSTHVMGKVYVTSGGMQLRGTFDVTESGGETYTADMLHVDGTSYVWSSQEPEGFLMHPEDGSLFGAEGQAALNKEETFGFSCVPWSVDESVFDVPQDREFIDIQAEMDVMMQGINESVGERINGDGSLKDLELLQCAICDEIPEEDGKAQCKLALGC